MGGLNIEGQLRDRAKALGGSVALPEATDPRTVTAARKLHSGGVARPILIGDHDGVAATCRKVGLPKGSVEIVDPMRDKRRDELIELLYLRRSAKGMTRDEAANALASPLMWGGLLVASGAADACVAGAVNTTADVIRTGLHTIGTREGLKTVSGAFLMILPRFADRINHPLVYADAGVVPDPTCEQLADIAESSATTFQKLTGEVPQVALLSFSTKGSAASESTSKVNAAIQVLKDRMVDFAFDGELQLDAAVVPDIAARKAPGSAVAGKANVLIFPNLDAGNIGYKITQRFAGATALGPLLQGLARPMMDLSRGCTADDIELVCACALLLGS
jgi:phosphate acetyltransferase